MPDFLVRLALRHHPAWAGRPLALLGADERVWAASREARLGGVCLHMRARQAQMRCPDILLRPLDVEGSQAEQSALLATLAQCGLPVEAQTWGVAYLDLRAAARVTQEIRPLCAEMGKQVGALLGESLQPALGWDNGKFTARAAASYARPGRMRLVGACDEARFLRPLPVVLLPLPPLALQQLDWLGIRTLGQFARLPSAAVWQRFGQAGRLAQRWAQGRDDRPVSPNARTLPPPATVDFDPPTALHGAALDAVLASLRPQLPVLAERLEGVKRLRLELRFAGSGERTVDCAFVEPLGEESRLRAILSHRLQTLNWPAELSALHVMLLDSGEMVARQFALWPEMAGPRSPFAGLAGLALQLRGRYGDLFFLSHILDERHPLAERRSALKSLFALS